jgi:hypothetical protein
VRKEKAERRKMTALDWAAKLVEDNGREIYECYLDAIKRGDWRAADSILSRIYGRPTEHQQVEDITSRPLEELSLAEIQERRLEIQERRRYLEQKHPELVPPHLRLVSSDE